MGSFEARLNRMVDAAVGGLAWSLERAIRLTGVAAGFYVFGFPPHTTPGDQSSSVVRIADATMADFAAAVIFAVMVAGAILWPTADDIRRPRGKRD